MAAVVIESNIATATIMRAVAAKSKVVVKTAAIQGGKKSLVTTKKRPNEKFGRPHYFFLL